MAPPPTPRLRHIYRTVRRRVPEPIVKSPPFRFGRAVVRVIRNRRAPPAPPPARARVEPVQTPVSQPSGPPQPGKLRIAIKIATPHHKGKELWGDYHFACAISEQARRLGHQTRVDLLPDWYGHTGDDVNLVLRGLRAFECPPDAVNLMWNISHPEQISTRELQSYDHVFIASATYPSHLTEATVPVTTLLQCTDHRRFYPDPDPSIDEPVLFVGSSRRMRRPVVMDALALDLPLSVYGGNWEGIIPERCFKGPAIPNSELRRHYTSAGVVLNDHWADMREAAFLSNRLFDVVASGGLVITDPIEGLSEVFGDGVATYVSPEELLELVRDFHARPTFHRDRVRVCSEHVRAEHTFERRTNEILDVAERLYAERSAGRGPRSGSGPNKS